MIMNNVVVWAEHRDNKLVPVSLELINKAKELAGRIQGDVAAILTGHQCGHLAEILIHHGASRVFLMEDPRLVFYQSDLYPKLIADLLKALSPEIVLVGGTSIGADLSPRIAAKMKTGLTAHCVNLYIENIDGRNQLIQVVPGWSGNMLIKIICPKRRPQMATVRPGVMEAGAPDLSRSGDIIPIKPEISDQEIKARTIEFVREAPEDVSLTDAGIIVSGGFGLGSAGGFTLIQELAAVIHGEVAGTRPAFDRGWIPESKMIGQSGKTVKPRLFISIGASGATHYTTGFLKSKTIVAIDRNPRAPIFGVADLGIVGDFREIVPCLLEKLKQDIEKKLSEEKEINHV
jgi:electron transfer flavoprotein alpha subunit